MSLKDVAQVAGVSIATVSHVLRGTKRSRPEVAERVREAARRLGYTPNRQARGLRTGRSQTLGVLIPDLTNPFFPALLNAVEIAARSSGYAVLVHHTENDPVLEREAMALLASFQVDGIVWVPVSTPPDVRNGVGVGVERDAADGAGAKHGPLVLNLPIVTVDRPIDGCDAVLADHEDGGAQVAAHLLERDLRRVALLSGPADVDSARARRRGFLRAFAPHEPVFQASVEFSHRLPTAVEARIGAGGFDAVVCANDAVAVGVVRALRRSAIRVPDDVNVVGFDDIPWSQMMDPPLTTVRQPLVELGAAAVQMLTDRIADPTLAPRRNVLPVELVVRASTASLDPPMPPAAASGDVGVRSA